MAQPKQRAPKESRPLTLGDRRPTNRSPADDNAARSQPSKSVPQPSTPVAPGSPERAQIVDRQSRRIRTRRLVVGGLLIVFAIAAVLIIRFVRPGEVAPATVSPRPAAAPQPAANANPASQPQPQPAQPAAIEPATSTAKTPTLPGQSTLPREASTRRTETPAVASPSAVGVPAAAPPLENPRIAPPSPPPVTLPETPRPPESDTVATVTPDFAKEAAALDELLGRYERAYDQLDASAAAAIWTSVDSHALARAFSQLRQQDLKFGACNFAVVESVATAQCPGELRYARRVGDTTLKTEHHVWTIHFARTDNGWRIVRMTAQ